jgi:hypothetical protein
MRKGETTNLWEKMRLKRLAGGCMGGEMLNALMYYLPMTEFTTCP